MIYIEIDENNEISYSNSKPFDLKDGTHKTQEEMERDGFFIDEIPLPQNVPGKSHKRYFNPLTREIYYEYIDKVKTQDELVREELMSQFEYTLDLDFRLSKIELGI